MNSSTRLKLMAVLLLATTGLVGCDVADSNNPNQGLVDMYKRPAPAAPVVAGEEYVNLDGTPVEPGEVLESKTTKIGNIEFSEDPNFEEDDAEPAGSNGKHMFYSMPSEPDEQQRLVDSLPPDGTEYDQDLQEMARAMQTREPGRLIGMPVGFADTGYPLYPVKCEFQQDRAVCTTDWGQKIDEDVLERKLTVVRNVDVVFLNITCGVVCVDPTGRVIGRVSVAMQTWRGENCTFSGYGSARCFEEDQS